MGFYDLLSSSGFPQKVEARLKQKRHLGPKAFEAAAQGGQAGLVSIFIKKVLT